jgi:hypothetical protein
MDIKPTSDQLTPVPTHTDTATPATGGGNFGKVLGGVVNIASQLASGAAGAQTMGLGPLAGSLLNGGSGGIGGAGGVGGGQFGDASFADLLKEQEQIQTESAQFTALTNISKTEHESRMSAIRNIRAG